MIHRYSVYGHTCLLLKYGFLETCKMKLNCNLNLPTSEKKAKCDYLFSRESWMMNTLKLVGGLWRVCNAKCFLV